MNKQELAEQIAKIIASELGGYTWEKEYEVINSETIHKSSVLRISEQIAAIVEAMDAPTKEVEATLNEQEIREYVLKNWWGYETDVTLSTCREAELKDIIEIVQHFIKGREVEAISVPAQQGVEKKRHFIVCYSANHVDGGYVNGYIDYTTDGSYLNKELTITQLGQKNPNCKNHIIKNIIELSHEDYSNWSAVQPIQPSLEEKKEDLELPKYLYKDGEYPMQLINGRYQTTTPDCKIGKIGNSYPPKKNFTYNDLINTGWEKKEDLVVSDNNSLNTACDKNINENV
jgi:hypothetical protein